MTIASFVIGAIAIAFGISLCVVSGRADHRTSRFLSLANLHPDDDEALQQARDQQSEGQGGFTQSHTGGNTAAAE